MMSDFENDANEITIFQRNKGQFSPENRPHCDLVKKNEQWRKVLSTFDPVKNIICKTSARRNISSTRSVNKDNNSLRRRFKPNTNNSSLQIFTSNVSSVFECNRFNSGYFKANLNKSPTVANSSKSATISNDSLATSSNISNDSFAYTKNKDYKNCTSKENKHSKTATTKSECSSSRRFTQIHKWDKAKNENSEETEIVWSSSDEESNDSRVLNRNTCTDRVQTNSYLKKSEESIIEWSSSNESNLEDSSINDNPFSESGDHIDPELDLSVFIQEIEKDFRRNKEIKQKLYTKKGGYLSDFRSAINKAKSDVRFLDYEHRAGILSGLKGIILKDDTSYGASTAIVKLENGTNCCIFLSKDTHTMGKENNVVCFIDISNFFKIDNIDFYIQPNKVVKA